MGLSFVGIVAPFLVVVHNLDLRRTLRSPNNHTRNWSLIRSMPLAIQRLKTVAWRRPQVAQIAGGIKVSQFPARHLYQIGRKTLRAFAVENHFGDLVPETPDRRNDVSSRAT
jgi:hypothetical protein